MNSRWSNIAVVALWLSTMSWLAIAKILPSLAIGNPPDRAAILDAQTDEETVGYEVLWRQQLIGWANIQARRTESGATQIRGQIRFDGLPIREMLPEMFLKILGFEASLPKHIRLDARNEVLFHANGRLQRFESTLALNPSISTVRVEGFVAGETMIFSIRSAGVNYETRRPLPRTAMMSDELMPQTRMPGLRQGRKWTLEVYSPLRSQTDAIEIMQAEVVGRDLITWAGRVEDVWLVVYRGDPGGNSGRDGDEHAWLWVRDDGMVLQHRIAVLDGMLTFVRLPDGAGGNLPPFDAESTQAALGYGEPGEGAYSPPPIESKGKVDTKQP